MSLTNASSRIIDFNIRGKRKKREPSTKNASSSSNPGPRGRPMKAASDLRSRKRKTTPPRTAFQPKTQSWLERLPIELLEYIFLHSLEISMIHALPFLRKTLSKESIYRVFILFAFFKDDRQHLVEQKHFDPACYRVLSEEERSRLQMAVLESRWCTMPRIKQCLPTLMRLVTVQLWHEERERAERGLTTPATQAGGGPQQQAGSSLPPLGDPPAVHPLSDAARPLSWPFQNDSNFRIKCHGISHRTFHMYKFPKRVLNPLSWHYHNNAHPFDFLTLLWNCSSTTNANQPLPAVDPSALLLGSKTAILEHHQPALQLLLQIHEQCPRTSQHGPEGEKCGASTSDIPVTLIHLATRQGRDSEWILELLLRGTAAGEGWIPKDDDVLTKWAIGREERGSHFARWLLGVMERDGVDMACGAAAGGK
jgi:hypothetical protein